MKARRFSAAAATLTAVALGLIPGLAHAKVIPHLPCGMISGPKWTQLTGSLSGSKYQVTAIGSFSCSTAKSWVAKLSKDVVKNSKPSGVNNNVLKNGPSGYACGALSSRQGKAFAGSCLRGPAVNPTSGFAWGGYP